jgi:hypothetical protein
MTQAVGLCGFRHIKRVAYLFTIVVGGEEDFAGFAPSDRAVSINGNCPKSR